MAFEWNESMATGVATVDDQHRKLIGALNHLMEALSQGKAREEIERLLTWLGEYAVHHFAHEEACMQRHQCPAAQANKDAHAAFLRIFTDLRGRVTAKGATTAVALEVERELVSWLRTHIGRIDTQLRPCTLRAAG